MGDSSWFTLLRDTLNMAGNLAECIGLLFLITQFHRAGKKQASTRPRTMRHRVTVRQRERARESS